MNTTESNKAVVRDFIDGLFTKAGSRTTSFRWYGDLGRTWPRDYGVGCSRGVRTTARSVLGWW